MSGDEVREDPACGTDNVGDKGRDNPVGRFVSNEVGLIGEIPPSFTGFSADHVESRRNSSMAKKVEF